MESLSISQMQPTHSNIAMTDDDGILIAVSIWTLVPFGKGCPTLQMALEAHQPCPITWKIYKTSHASLLYSRTAT